MTDLFGQKIIVLKPGGYAGSPGSGPAGETCKTCENYTHVHYRDGVFRKCGLVQQTHGKGTDIQARAPACIHWEKAK